MAEEMHGRWYGRISSGSTGGSRHNLQRILGLKDKSTPEHTYGGTLMTRPVTEKQKSRRVEMELRQFRALDSIVNKVSGVKDRI